MVVSSLGWCEEEEEAWRPAADLEPEDFENSENEWSSRAQP